ncbi:alpha-L-fucosidase [Cronobacter malonaticus]|nr:alpha-L-fucosidase [Cronobacter malonaticus]HAU5445948.1 alpha-L-fucosidase [Cronobacter malonaticus]
MCVLLISFIMVKKYSAVLIDNATFTCLFNELACFLAKL